MKYNTALQLSRWREQLTPLFIVYYILAILIMVFVLVDLAIFKVITAKERTILFFIAWGIGFLDFMLMKLVTNKLNNRIVRE